MRSQFRLFRLFGIDVYLHFAWVFVAFIEISQRARNYHSLVWNIAEYLALFLLVLMHEFGHSLACRSVGGTANRILLWPLGGVAYVSPPPRPGALLWSIAAGPLVNVALVPLLLLIDFLAGSNGLKYSSPDAYHLLHTIYRINLGLLVFNLMPAYPLDGGQILRALLWFPFGRARSLKIAAAIGVVAAVALGAFAFFYTGSAWLGVIALFMVSRSWAGWREATSLSKFQDAARHTDFACPSCGISPLQGDWWVCNSCRQRFDTFASGAICPHCSTQFPSTLCPECRSQHPMETWRKRPVMDAVNQP